MKWKLNKRNGISLIVLVITIIVMIILAAAIILSLSSSGIIGKAKEAKTTSDEATIKEVANLLLAEYELGVQTGEIDPSVTTVQAYVQEGLEKSGVDTSTVVVKDDGKVMVGLSKVAMAFVKAGVKVGDTVTGYTLSTATDTKTYATSGNENTCNQDTYRDDTAQPDTIERDENVTWTYIGIDEEGNALIAGSVTSTTPKMTIGGKGGYLNGPTELDAACKAMYSTSKGEARSMNIDDVTRVLEYEGEQGVYYDVDGNEHLLEEPLTIEEIAKQINFDYARYGSEIAPKGNPLTYVVNYYIININLEADKEVINEDMIYLIYPAPTKPTLTSRYWLASACVYANFHFYAPGGFYEMRVVDIGKVTSATMLWPDVEANWDTAAVRPVVVLNSNVQMTYDGTTVTLK